jgi:hypothetical protein
VIEVNKEDIFKDNKSFLKSYSLAKTMKDNTTTEGRASLNKSEKAHRYVNMVKQNTDYLYARQLSEEMESTIVRIQPGGKASNCDKVSRNSSEVFRQGTNDSNKMLYFGAQNQEKSKDISPIGEHIIDEDIEESSKFASNFGVNYLKDKAPFIKNHRDVGKSHYRTKSAQQEKPILASPSDLNPDGTSHVDDEDAIKLNKIPTS